MTAPERVEIMDRGAVVFLISCLDPSFRHHGVRIPDTKFRNDGHFRTRFVRHDRRGRSRAAPADHKNVGFDIRAGKVDIHAEYARSPLQKIGEFMKHLVSLIRSDFQVFVSRFDIVRVVFF